MSAADICSQQQKIQGEREQCILAGNKKVFALQEPKRGASLVCEYSSVPFWQGEIKQQHVHITRQQYSSAGLLLEGKPRDTQSFPGAVSSILYMPEAPCQPINQEACVTDCLPHTNTIHA